VTGESHTPADKAPVSYRPRKNLTKAQTCRKRSQLSSQLSRLLENLHVLFKFRRNLTHSFTLHQAVNPRRKLALSSVTAQPVEQAGAKTSEKLEGTKKPFLEGSPARMSSVARWPLVALLGGPGDSRCQCAPQQCLTPVLTIPPSAVGSWGRIQADSERLIG